MKLTPLLLTAFILFASACASDPKLQTAGNSRRLAGSEVYGAAICSETPVAAQGDDSVHKKYFEELLKRGQKAPLGAFLKLWYPDTPVVADSPFFACEDESGHLKLRAGERLSEDCKPDTLYSWGSREKLRAFAARIPDGGPWDKYVFGERSIIYTSHSAVSTYGYGPYLVRFKVRRGVPVVANKFQEASIGVSAPIQEYDFLESSVIDSWSTGTPEIYDEVVRDILRFQSGERVGAYLFLNEWPANVKGKAEGLSRLYAQAVDGNRQDEKQLKEALLNLLRQILNGEGRIYYSSEACRNRALHFSTDKPSYINPRGY